MAWDGSIIFARALSLNIDCSCLWNDPLGEEALGIIIHECSHAEVSGHCKAFEKESARIGARFGLWVAANPQRWADLHHDLYDSDTGGSQSP